MKVGQAMKSSLGKTLRMVRKGKQMSLSAVADEHLSKSQISRFERGESEISCIRLINILDKLNTSLDEFLILHDGDNKKSDNFSALLNFIRTEYYSKRYHNIKSLLLPNTPFRIGSYETVMKKSIISYFEPEIKPTLEEIAKLTDYLFKIEKWGYYEITLLGNCVKTIEYDTVILLTKEMLRDYIYSSLNKINKILVTQLSINCLIASIEQRNYKFCDFLLNEITILLKNELNYFEKTVFLYAQGFYEFRLGKSTGKMKMGKALQVFDLLEEYDVAAYYIEHYNKLMNE